MTPTGEQFPNWPDQRSLSRYQELLSLDLNAWLRPLELWVDIGCANAVALREMKSKLPTLEAVGVNLLSYDLPSEITEILGSLPADSAKLAPYTERARLVTDVYGASSYCEDPLRAMLLELSLLAPGGRVITITRHDLFADDALARFESLVRAEFGVRFSLTQFEATSDNRPGQMVTPFRIVLDRGPLPIDFNQATQVLEAKLGRATRGERIWVSHDGKVTMHAILYRA